MNRLGNKQTKRSLLSAQTIAALLTLLFVLSVFRFGSLLSNAGDNSRPFAKAPVYKYYTSIRIQDGDTLWDIADSYLNESAYEKRDYIEEIKRLNQIDENEIRSGQYLLIPYYSEEYL